MKLTSAVRNAICTAYQKEYQRFIKELQQFDDLLTLKSWNELAGSFFLANWIGLYWFFVEHQNATKPHKKISKTTWELLMNKKFGQILAKLFNQNFHSNKVDELMKWVVNPKEKFIDCAELCQYLDQNAGCLSVPLDAFIKKLTPLLVTFSVYDLFISKMKFIFEYPDDEKFVYEQNVCLIQHQISLLSIIQSQLQSLTSFNLRNDAIILVTTLRKDIWNKPLFSQWSFL